MRVVGGSQPAPSCIGGDGPLCEAGAGDDAFGRIDASDALDECPAVLVLLQDAHGLANRDGELVVERGREGVGDGHETRRGHGLLLGLVHLGEANGLVVGE